MKLSITFHLVTESENQARRAPFILASMPPEKARKVAFALTGKTAKVRKEVAKALLCLPKPKAQLPTGEEVPVDIERQLGNGPRWRQVYEPNTYRVTYTRIGGGLLDKVNLGGALKAVEDEVCKWLGIDDGPRDRRYEGVFKQALCTRGFKLVRIEIEDADSSREGKTVLLGEQPPSISDAVSEGAPVHKPPKRVTKRGAGKSRRSAASGNPEQQRLPSKLQELNERLATVVAGGKQAARDVAAALRGAETVALLARGDAARTYSARDGWHPAPRKVFYIDPRDQRRVLIPTASDPPPRVLRLHSEVDGVRFVAATLTRQLVGDEWIYDKDTTPDGYVEGIEAKKAALKASRAKRRAEKGTRT